MDIKSTTLLNSVRDFYHSDENNSKHLVDILEKKNGISLRNIEWFITNYSKKTNLSYQTDDGKKFIVHCAYKSSLDGYSKKLFDPFCRTTKINFNIPNSDRTISTTVAQLNFIKWCIKNNIIQYFLQNKSILMLRKNE
jgi:hypothetical protein